MTVSWSETDQPDLMVAEFPPHMTMHTVFDREMFAVGIEHQLNRDGWTARVALDDATDYVTTGARWQTTGRWQRSTWDTP